MEPGPLYARIARSIENAVTRGDLPPGTILPSERALAHVLHVGRSTVVAAYDKLRTDGTVISRRGGGTWVAGAERGSKTASSADSLSSAAPDSSTLVDLATARFPTATVVKAGLAELDGRLSDEVLNRSGYSPSGLPELRRAVAGMFTDQGLRTSPDQILITTGTQQALSLLTGHFVNAGDRVLVEDPCTPGMLDLLHSVPTVIKGVLSVASTGVQPFMQVTRGNFSLAYLISAGGPEGRVVTAENMRRLGGSLHSFSGIVIEDASSRPLADDPPPYLATCAPEGTVVTIGSMSKVFWGGLRVGWIRATEELIRRLGRDKRRHDLGTPLLSQLLSVWLLARLEDVSAERVAQLHRQRDVAEELLSRYLPSFTYVRPEAGLTFWLRLPRGASGPFTEVARRHGVGVVSGESLSVAGTADAHIRVAIGAPTQILTQGFLRLRQAWAAYDRAGFEEAGMADATFLL
jgi:DNA-binding transcriptional MocR family regulator